ALLQKAQPLPLAKLPAAGAHKPALVATVRGKIAQKAHAELPEHAPAAAKSPPAAEGARPEALRAASTAAQLAPAPAPKEVTPPRELREAAPPVPAQHLELDPATNLTLLPRAAHFAVQSDEHGPLRLHLRVRDGVA